jgi:phage terminase large subunit
MRAENYRKYTVAGLGEWGIAEGLVYENCQEFEFDFQNLGIERDEKGEVITDESWKYKSFFGLDYGYTNDPTAFIAFSVNKIDKELFIFDEHYEVKMLNSDIAEMIKRKGFAKERIRADAAEPKSNEDLRRLGIGRVLPSVKGKDSILNGITQIQEYKIYVHPKCVNTKTELSSYCWQKDKSENGINKPSDSNNHLMDALRYGFYDVLFFHPTKEKARVRTDRSNITAADMNGSWI